VTERLHERARGIRERALVRAWEYRQRNHAKGVWHRLRRLLVDAGQAWIIDEAAADKLEAAGHAPHPVGRELVPPKRLFIVSETELKEMHVRHQIPVRMGVELLQARSVCLCPSPERAVLDAPGAPG
jgi:hypothetical protein